MASVTAPKVKVGVVSLVGPVGPPLMVGAAGGVVSTVKARVAGAELVSARALVAVT